MRHIGFRTKQSKRDINFFVLATKSGYIVNFTPDGSQAAYVGEEEYNNNKNIGKGGDNDPLHFGHCKQIKRKATYQDKEHTVTNKIQQK